MIDRLRNEIIEIEYKKYITKYNYHCKNCSLSYLFNNANKPCSLFKYIRGSCLDRKIYLYYDNNTE